ncbi:Uncharacterised protein [Klebsiella pneumoniae]|nr:Uncharacterised protein [Klebsiella pneumoniae]
MALIFKHSVAENFFQLFDLFVAELVFFRLFAGAAVAVLHVGVKVRLITAVVKFTDAGVALGLARQQVYFFKVFPFLVLLHDELAIAGGSGELHLIEWAIFAPLVALFPAVNGCNFFAQHFSNAGYAVSLKIQQ